MPRSKSSRRWLNEHFKDPYVKKAQQGGYRSRAVYKLMELHEKEALFKPGMTIVDLGAAPGSFAQFLAEKVGKTGTVIAVDLLNMDPLPGVTLIQGDFTEETVFQAVLTHLNHQPVDWVISDMAPNLSGIPSVDQVRSLHLAELALDFALKVLSPRGGLLVKVFQGSGFDLFLKQMKTHFKSVSVRKPKASRDRSKEIYLLAIARKA